VRKVTLAAARSSPSWLLSLLLWCAASSMLVDPSDPSSCLLDASQIQLLCYINYKNLQDQELIYVKYEIFANSLLLVVCDNLWTTLLSKQQFTIRKKYPCIQLFFEGFSKIPLLCVSRVYISCIQNRFWRF
jgi:hypothetical protein